MRSVLVWGVLLFACFPLRAENVLVLPFFNLTSSSNLDWLGESMAETIREALASRGIIALSRDDRQEAYRRLSIRPYSRLTRATVMRLGESLDAGRIIFGSFDLSNDRTSPGKGTLRITAQIINLGKISRGPEYTEIGALQDLAQLQHHLAWQTLQFVLGSAAPTEGEYKRLQTPIPVGAIESYIRGLLAPTPDQQFKLFMQAVQLEPRYSQANFMLGQLLYQRKSYRQAVEYLSSVASTDVQYRNALFFLGLCHYRLLDYAAAERAFASVASAVPLNEVLNNLGAAQSRIGSRDTALENLKKALDGDATDPDYHFNVGYALFLSGDFPAAAERFRAVLDRNPSDTEAITMLGRCLKRTSGPRSDTKSEGLERLKESFEESAFLQLKAVLEGR